jgi:hypothetical protein
VRILDWVTGDRDELAAFIGSLLTAGFWSYADVAEWVHAWVEDSGIVSQAEAAALLELMWSERIAVQSSWADTGDYGRLQRSFDQLEADGVVAWMCFWCCQRCALGQIGSERAADPDPADGWYPYREWAYTFFHEQDALALGNPNATMYLAYGPYRPHPSLPAELDDAACGGDGAAQKAAREWSETKVADQIVEVTRRNGLEVHWSGSPAERIRLGIHDWRKPLPQVDTRL